MGRQGVQEAQAVRQASVVKPELPALRDLAPLVLGTAALVAAVVAASSPGAEALIP